MEQMSSDATSNSYPERNGEMDRNSIDVRFPRYARVVVIIFISNSCCFLCCWWRYCCYQEHWNSTSQTMNWTALLSNTKVPHLSVRRNSDELPYIRIIQVHTCMSNTVIAVTTFQQYHCYHHHHQDHLSRSSSSSSCASDCGLDRFSNPDTLAGFIKEDASL